jgi:hypothetical protein
VQRQDVRMLQVRGGANLSQEPLASEDCRKFGAEEFQRDRAVVADIPRQEHERHAAGAEFTLDAVFVLETCGKPIDDSQRAPRWK